MEGAAVDQGSEVEVSSIEEHNGERLQIRTDERLFTIPTYVTQY